MLAIALSIGVATFVFRIANKTGKNGLKWAIISFVSLSIALFIAQFPVLIALLIAAEFYSQIFRIKIDLWAKTPSFFINITGILVAWPIIGAIYRRVIKVPDLRLKNPSPPPIFKK